MKYKIIIWQYKSEVDRYENDNIKEILKWYKDKWQHKYDIGDCSFSIFEDNKRLDFDEVYKLGFYE